MCTCPELSATVLLLCPTQSSENALSISNQFVCVVAGLHLAVGSRFAMFVSVVCLDRSEMQGSSTAS
jgi:hypothetical protein